ncbi:adropin isoform X1 [Nannospalax galili]|uniref:adropin isoform X1 n=1 Tax=Nannospalax galili TaxID=1026970 RepID=UPI0004ED5578|nr:adropin isoform X1 [Nannospalax galili]
MARGLARPANGTAAAAQGWRRPRRPQAGGHSGGGALRCFCGPPSSAELLRLPPAGTEPSRTYPSPAELRDAPAAAERASERASELAAPATEEAPPQGEEVPARRRPPAAEAGPVAPRRERPAKAARPRGRAQEWTSPLPASRRPPPAGSRASLP